jgi:ribosome-associated heat shock protein Hsp15
MGLRVDKFLWVVRLAKTRSAANALVTQKKVQCNGNAVKPSREVKIGDLLTLQKGNAVFSFKVLNLSEMRVSAPLVPTLIEDITSNEERQKYSDYLSAQSAYQVFGKGKPSKKDRRVITQFKEDTLSFDDEN